ncbi:M48 family metallopeptidase [Citrobacter rodentium]|uniref:Membrane protein n=2 Tax=Citrobacter rodentium TaxID=67825 RepID=D2TQD6_CITRI|nr:M48 family metallopeptidase [Citrobacter rodentium]QBY27469.1 hypothetical protein E2R62_00565 [Citrobacter rodentium]UHO30621.1 M48 family metalloprotease [Citrobacter rodentium NBRC 105723 = DSM 16636]CBG87602.1 putative membrane protein [Citrobacter rodentium ICC168]HAT8012757.1 hypothetical protein [Citrobacter rodentium NBRC 105723 = DSM 16636]HAT8018066.1 hypothetical protein [Citrobacter rodentium]
MMEQKKIWRLFIIPVSLVCYALWLCGRVANTFYDAAFSAVTRGYLSVLALGLAGGALILTGAAVTICVTSARASRQSQEALVQRFSLCRRLLPVFMVAQIVLCGLSVISLALAEGLWLVFAVGGEAIIKFVMILLFFIGVIVWMLVKSLASIRKCFALFEPEDMTISGITVSEAKAPQLWQWVRELNQEGRLIVPDNIVAGFFDCFYVTANPVQISAGERLTGNTLYLPLTYMALLERNEIAAVLGHELAHFSGADTQYSLRFLPLYAGMQNSLESMACNSQGYSWLDYLVLRPALEMGMWFLSQFHESVIHWERIREYAADADGANVSSPAALASGLLRMTVLEPVINRHLEDIFYGRVVSENWIASLITTVQPLGRFARPDSINNEMPHPMDSHPTTLQRINALNVPLDDELWARALRPVAQEYTAFFEALFVDAAEVCSFLSRDISAETAPRREAYRQELETKAAEGKASVVFWTSRKTAWFCAPVSLLLLAGGSYLLIAESFSAWFWLLPVLGVIVGMASVVTVQRSRRPMFTLNEDFLTSPWVSQSLPLKQVVDYSLLSINSSTTIKLALDEAFQPQMTTKWFMQPVRYNPRRHEVVIIISGALYREQEGRKVKLEIEQVAELIGQYLVAAHARAELTQF